MRIRFRRASETCVKAVKPFSGRDRLRGAPVLHLLVGVPVGDQGEGAGAGELLHPGVPVRQVDHGRRGRAGAGLVLGGGLTPGRGERELARVEADLVPGEETSGEPPGRSGSVRFTSPVSDPPRPPYFTHLKEARPPRWSSSTPSRRLAPACSPAPPL